MRRVVAVVFAGMLVLGACGSDDFDRDELVEEFVDESGGAIDQAQAECIVDGMINEFGEDKLNSNDEPTDEEEEKVLEITFGCIG